MGDGDGYRRRCVLPAPAPASAASEVLIDGETRWCYAGQPVELHPSEGGGYWLNLNSPAPCILQDVANERTIGRRVRR